MMNESRPLILKTRAFHDHDVVLEDDSPLGWTLVELAAPDSNDNECLESPDISYHPSVNVSKNTPVDQPYQQAMSKVDVVQCKVDFVEDVPNSSIAEGHFTRHALEALTGGFCVEDTSEKLKVTLASLKKIPGVDKAYLGRRHKDPSQRAAVVLTTGVYSSRLYPTHLDDGTPVVLTSPYILSEYQPPRTTTTHGYAHVRAVFIEWLPRWRHRANVLDVFQCGDEAQGYYFMIMVFGKGIIPDGEEPIPREVDGVPVEVVERRYCQI